MLSRSQQLRESIDQSESIILINLDSQRNVMLRLSLQLGMGMFSMTLAGMMGVAFGMNLDSSLEEVFFCRLYLLLLYLESIRVLDSNRFNGDVGWINVEALIEVSRQNITTSQLFTFLFLLLLSSSIKVQLIIIGIVFKNQIIIH